MAVFWLSLLQNMLGHIVAVLICDEKVGTSMYFIHYGRLVHFRPVLHQALNNSATIRVRCHLANRASECIHNEISVLTRYDFNHLLNYVIAILIFYNTNDVALKLCDELCLLFDKDMFKSLRQKRNHC